MSNSQYVVFEVENECFALDISKVKEIINPLEFAKVPNMPDFIEGMINMRGNIYAVVNLRNKFHFPRKQLDENAKIILVNIESQLVGVLVDSVTEILRVEDGEINETPELISKVDAEFIKGVIKKEKNMVILLDIDRVIDSAA